MIFEISNTDEEDINNKYNLNLKMIKKGIFQIEFKTIEDLILFSEKIDMPIIINDGKLEIYDNYRE